MFRLPELTFELPRWPEKAFFEVHAHVHKVREIAKKAGSGSDKFKQACKKIKMAFESAYKPSLSKLLIDRTDVRAFTYLLTADKQFAENVMIDKALLEQLLKASEPLTKLTLTQLIRAYLVYFDEIASKDALEDWSFFINKQLSAYDGKATTNQLVRYAENRDWLFSVSGPVRLASKAQSQKTDLDTYTNHLGLDGYAKSRFMTLARYQYYLKQLESLPVGQDSDLLAELVKPDVFNAPYENNQLLGHEILRLMIDRSAGQSLSDSWQRVILSIAGDPRVPKSSPKYQKWWSILGERRIALIRGWLSRFDLSLFLKVLEQSAKDGSNDDMERMFKPRKAFIEGLDKSGVIAESRLFLSAYAERYLRKHFKQEELPSYAKVSSQQTSMIYLNLDNKIHMIEGSHSFTLKLMDKLPSACRVNDYSRKIISNDELRTAVGFQYRNEFKYESGIEELRHDQHLNWQHNAIRFLNRHKVKLIASDLIDKSEYRDYKKKFGVR